MRKKRTKERATATADVHAVMPADVLAKLKAFAAFHGRTQGDVLAEGARIVMRGFSIHQQLATIEEPQGTAEAGEPTAIAS